MSCYTREDEHVREKTRYRQCRLRKQTTTGFLRQVAYLPDSYARQGTTVRIRQKDGTWSPGWFIEEVASTTSTQSQLSRPYGTYNGRSLTKRRKA